MRGFISGVARLSARLRLMECKQSVLCLTETWADKGLPTMRLEGYTLMFWHDCADGRQGGGVLVFALKRLAHRVTLLGNSQVPERSWAIIHTVHGPHVIGCWYRPPAPGEVDTVRSLKKEGQLHAANAGVCVVLGEINDDVVEVLQQEQPRRPGAERRLQGARPDTTGAQGSRRLTTATPLKPPRKCVVLGWLSSCGGRRESKL